MWAEQFLDHDEIQLVVQTISWDQTTYVHKPHFNLLWGSGRDVRHLPGKRGRNRRAGRKKWDWCCLLEEAHSTRLLGLGDNLLLICENKMWSHTWLLFLFSHLPWARMKMTSGSLCECVCVCVGILLHAGNALLHAKTKFIHAESFALKLGSQTHANASCLQVHFTGGNEDLWLIRLNF